MLFQCGSRDAINRVSTATFGKLLIFNVLYVVTPVETWRAASLQHQCRNFDTPSAIIWHFIVDKQINNTIYKFAMRRDVACRVSLTAGLCQTHCISPTHAVSETRQCHVSIRKQHSGRLYLFGDFVVVAVGGVAAHEFADEAGKEQLRAEYHCCQRQVEIGRIGDEYVAMPCV